MAFWVISNELSGKTVGVFEGKTAEEAFEALAEDCGDHSYDEDLVAQEVTELDLREAFEKAEGCREDVCHMLGSRKYDLDLMVEAFDRAFDSLATDLSARA